MTALGCFDLLMAANGPTSVGLWASDGSLLASSLVTDASGLFNQTRYEAIAPVTLEPGQSYFLGTYSPRGTTIVYGIAGPPEGSLNTAPEVQVGTAVIGVGGFMFPATTVGGQGSAILGPNFEYVVPEPSCAALLGLSALGLALSRKSR